MEINHLNTQSIAGIVQSDYRCADVFKKYGINYCCGGNISLADACQAIGIDADMVSKDLYKATRTVVIPNNLAIDEWKIEFLIDYIVHVHHAYLTAVLPETAGNMTRFADGHQQKYPFIQKVAALVNQLAELIMVHNAEEEKIIFPYIKQLENTWRRREIYGSLFVRTLGKPLHMHEAAHRQIDQLLDDIRQATSHFTFPEKACTQLQVLYRKLQEIDQDIIRHQFLENDILFPRAMKMEQELMFT